MDTYDKTLGLYNMVSDSDQLTNCSEETKVAALLKPKNMDKEGCKRACSERYEIQARSIPSDIRRSILLVVCWKRRKERRRNLYCWYRSVSYTHLTLPTKRIV